ncbi:hypothetical protein C5167_007054 [Papaver somniferum]|uniref:Uncharacterized protein n=1 Tax=Papaver somniferum TaxID=3469 RepID=A0A4Y7JG32_PAPSO|nr:hypothetical protein C5167_007054 [Papaver somniferum]
MSRCETINRMILEACARRDEEQRQERMDDYVAAGLTPEQILAAEKAYFDKYRFRGRMIGMAISCDFPSGQEFGKSDSESEDEKKAVKEKFEDLRINT